MTAPPDTTRESFEKFLLWLSPDREAALAKYSEIMKKMNKYFTRKGCLDPEDLAGETRDRVIRIVNASEQYSNPEALFYGVANRVWKEFARKPKPEMLPVDDLLSVFREDNDGKERQSNCLERCLAQLPEPERDLITRYYLLRGRSNTEARKIFMAEFGGENTLRVKAFRIRSKLRICIEACMGGTVK